MNQDYLRILFVVLSVAAIGASAAVGRSVADRPAQAWHGIAEFQGQGITIEADPGNLKAVAAGSSAGLMLSNDGARTWDGQGIGGVPVFDLKYVPARGGRPARLIAGARSALFFSGDRGVSWDKFKKLPFLDYRAIAVNRSNPGEIWTGAWTGGFPGPTVFRTSDGGSTWFSIDGGPSGNDIGAILISPARSSKGKGKAFGRGKTFVYVGTYGKGMWATSDGGATWTQLSRGMKVDESIMAAAITSADGGSLVAGTSEGEIFYTGNSGLSWSKAKLPAGFVDKAVELRSFAWDEAAPNTVYAVVGGTGKRFIVSHDRGKSWSAAPETGLIDGPLRSLSLDPKERRLYVTGDLGSSLLTLPDP